jgi:hypothetical protein
MRSSEGEDEMRTEVIRELRSALQSHNPIASYATAPDWAILALYERHCGLPQSSAGMPATRSLAEINRKWEKRATKAPAIAAPVISDAERQQMKRRLEIASL